MRRNIVEEKEEIYMKIFILSDFLFFISTHLASMVSYGGQE